MQELQAIADLLKAIPGASIGGREISLAEILYAMKIQGDLLAPLERALGALVLLEAAEREGVKASREAVQAEVRLMERELGLKQGSETRWWLRRNALTEDEFEAAAERRVIVRNLKAKVTDPLIEPFFASHRKDFPFSRLDRRTRAVVANTVWRRWVNDEVERRHALVTLPSLITEP
jgi:hypothetical protein